MRFSAGIHSLDTSRRRGKQDHEAKVSMGGAPYAKRQLIGRFDKLEQVAGQFVRPSARWSDVGCLWMKLTHDRRMWKYV